MMAGGHVLLEGAPGLGDDPVDLGLERERITVEVEELLRKRFGDKVFDTTIPRNVRIAEAPSHGMPVLIYDNACAGSQAYILLASEFIRRRRTIAEKAEQKAPHEPAS